MTGKLFLSGGGNEKQTIEIDNIFFNNINKVLYVPLAWPNDDFQSCLKWFTNMTSIHKKVQITMLTDANQEINLSKFDAIYIGGGNTFKLLKRLKESRLDKKLIKYLKNGGTIYGGSAGAIIWGKTIDTAMLCKDKDKNEVGIKDTNGFNLIKNYDIQCHFEDDQIKEHQEYIKKTGRNIIAIPEESAILVENNKYTAIGTKPITLITSEKAVKFSSNKEIKI